MYKLKFHKKVEADLELLSTDILEEVVYYFKLYKSEPYKYSQKLHNQGGLNLEGYRKTYLANATYRIVLKIENDVAKIVEIVTVGQREDKQVYKEADSRVSDE